MATNDAIEGRAARLGETIGYYLGTHPWLLLILVALLGAVFWQARRHARAS